MKYNEFAVIASCGDKFFVRWWNTRSNFQRRRQIRRNFWPTVNALFIREANTFYSKLEVSLHVHNVVHIQIQFNNVLGLSNVTACEKDENKITSARNVAKSKAYYDRVKGAKKAVMHVACASIQFDLLLAHLVVETWSPYFFWCACFVGIGKDPFSFMWTPCGTRFSYLVPRVRRCFICYHCARSPAFCDKWNLVFPVLGVSNSIAPVLGDLRKSHGETTKILGLGNEISYTNRMFTRVFYVGIDAISLALERMKIIGRRKTA